MEHLKGPLERLDKELAKAEPEGKAGEHAENLKADVKSTLAQPGQPGLKGLKQRLQDAVVHFEEKHPNLTAAAEEVIDALARMGI